MHCEEYILIVQIVANLPDERMFMSIREFYLRNQTTEKSDK